MSKEKTHYRKAFKSPYLSSADIVGNTVLTVARVTLEGDKSKKTKDQFNTMYFVERELRKGEPLKPMILNACNSKTMRELTGSHYIDDWNDIKITVYVDPNVRFGRETVEGLRISPKAPVQYDQTKFDNNYPKWVQMIEEGKKTAHAIISMMSSGFSLSDSQFQKLRELENIRVNDVK